MTSIDPNANPDVALANTQREPFFDAVGVLSASDDVPERYPVGLGGIGFMLDLEFDIERYTTQSVRLLRDQNDLLPLPGENSINPEDFWRRSVDSWHRGAGLRFLDELDPEADEEVDDLSRRARFRRSLNIDTFEFGEMQLLRKPEKFHTTTNTGLHMVVAGPNLYVADGTDLLRFDDSFVLQATIPITGGETANEVETDGFNVWVATDTDLYYVTTATDTMAAWPSTAKPADKIGYAKGRLLGAKDNVLFEYRAQGEDAVDVYTHPNVDWTWSDITDGTGYIYACGHSYPVGLVYKIGIIPETSALDVPIVAVRLPDSELPLQLITTAGVVVLATLHGLRYGIEDQAGNITLGKELELDQPATVFEADRRFVWFNMDDWYPNTTGLGRLDLSTLNQSTPAWASDLSVTDSGAIESIVTYPQLHRCFSVAGSGLYRETDDFAEEGWLESGLLGYRLTDAKTPVRLSYKTGRGCGEIEAQMAWDEEDQWLTIGASACSDDSTSRYDWNTPHRQGEYFETRFLLKRGVHDDLTTHSPILERWTLRVDPVVRRRDQIILPLIFHRNLMPLDNNVIEGWPVQAMVAQVRDWSRTRAVLALQEGTAVTPVVVDDFAWFPYKSSDSPRHHWDGTMVIVCKTMQ